MANNRRNSETQGVQNGGTHTPIRDANAAQRAGLAVKLRAQKVKYDDIAKMCGFSSAGAAHKAVMRELDRVVSENVKQLRKEELDSLEQLELACWKRMQDKEYAKNMLFAVDRILSIKERRAKLMGLDVPIEKNQNTQQIIIRETPPYYMTQKPQELLP